MDIALLKASQRRLGILGGKLAVIALDGNELRPLREELRRAAFVDVDVRTFIADDCAVVRRQGRDRERVRRRAGGDGEDRDVLLEQA